MVPARSAGCSFAFRASWGQHRPFRTGGTLACLQGGDREKKTGDERARKRIRRYFLHERQDVREVPDAHLCKASQVARTICTTFCWNWMPTSVHHLGTSSTGKTKTTKREPSVSSTNRLFYCPFVSTVSRVASSSPVHGPTRRVTAPQHELRIHPSPVPIAFPLFHA